MFPSAAGCPRLLEFARSPVSGKVSSSPRDITPQEGDALLRCYSSVLYSGDETKNAKHALVKLRRRTRATIVVYIGNSILEVALCDQNIYA